MKCNLCGKEIKEGRLLIKDIVKNIRKEQFKAKKNSFCDKCTFKFTCKEWGGY